LPRDVDTNEWVQYLLGGIRQFPVKLVSLDPDGTGQIGPFKVAVMRVEMEGQFKDLGEFLQWLALNQRLFRVSTIRLAPGRDDDGLLSLQLTLTGVSA
jgi:hypothetical protein